MEELEKQLDSALSEIEIPAALHAWAIKELKRMNEHEMTQRAAQVGAWRRQLDDVTNTMNNLVVLRANSEISPDQFNESMTPLRARRQQFEDSLNGAEHRIDSWIDIAEKSFDFAEKARTAFDTGSSETKKHILASLGSNLYLKDRKLSIDWAIPFLQIRGMSKEAREISSRLEPAKSLLIQDQLEENYSTSSTLLRG